MALFAALFECLPWFIALAIAVLLGKRIRDAYRGR